MQRWRAALLAGASSAALAAAGDECVKVLGYEWSGEKQSMDPADMHSGDDAYHTFAVYNRLVDIDDTFNVLPELATEWSVSADGLTWTFKLREGVKFHSGKDFSSADVVYTFKRLLDEKTGSGARAVLEFLDPNGIKAADATTVTFTTTKPVVELPILISNKFTNIVPEGATQEQLRLHGDGTGPFMQEQFTPNEPVRILRKNPNYWNAGQPKAELPENYRGAGSGGRRLGPQGRTGRPDAQRRSVGHSLAQGRSQRAASGDRSLELDDGVDVGRHQTLRRHQGQTGAQGGGRPPGDGRHGAAGLRRNRRRQSGADRAIPHPTSRNRRNRTSSWPRSFWPKPATRTG